MKSITFRLSDEEKEILQQFADKNDVSVSWVVRKAIKDFITNQTKENKDGEQNNLCFMGNGEASEIRLLSSYDITES